MSFLTRSFNQLMTGRVIPNNTLVDSIKNSILGGNAIGSRTGLASILGLNLDLGLQRRWKSRGNTYQPSTLKRKRRIGFLARARSKQGNKILERRKAKGRWYLTH
ncbi:hypothetical protein TPHA_0A01770 [Tetrapisispora phaffii CBS 4417]|uniref:Large ribosomal subunit protein bL34m n=1 Tax=Tetrapisispora phaffii (strain ATCC 24235 / CBS 4417 / NBRC 1672 / NRRL Y-8282 / UCD 70-5) TaxID=1071381 RepID=G8BMY2_TETPH|nr:hypothetical protein TPHA_0A01770 [Tetrapisispora phaffii CBS 4417]CCE61260.1 hypothetical protein TPHA_0A01770 [Tetrapisispora phaffii CBS 4417]